VNDRRPVVGVMGAGEPAADEALVLAEQLGAECSRRGWAVLSGGRPLGVMAAVSRGARSVPGHLVIGVLPESGEATAAVDVALFTGMGQARNVINVLSADVVVVCGGGGPGTASEACHALKAGRPLVLLAVPAEWVAFFRSLSRGVSVVPDVASCCRTVAAQLAER
jgi:hypothetical protein